MKHLLLSLRSVFVRLGLCTSPAPQQLDFWATLEAPEAPAHPQPHKRQRSLSK